MAVTRDTLTQVRALRVVVGVEADDTVRALTTAWARAWTELAKPWRDAAGDVADLAVELDRWPRTWELAKLRRLRAAVDLAERALLKLAEHTGVTVTDTAGRVIEATVKAEPGILASQLPAGERAAAAISFDRIPAAALDAIVRRTTEQIVATSWPLAAAASDVMRRELVRGVAVGANPRETARRIVARTEQGFAGGLNRAANIARTETLDVCRAASRASHVANGDTVRGWVWTSALDRRSCASCWAMHGTEYGVDEPGPHDHQSGRCARVPLLRSWRDLGINLTEPASTFPDARIKFGGLPEADQVAILGPARHDLWKSGRIDWDDMAQRRTTPGWRPSHTLRSVADLRRRARQPA